MSKRLTSVYGLPLPVHECTPRSPIATALATVFTQPDGMPPLRWHHQLIIDLGTSQPIAIRFCPFCGVELDLLHFEPPAAEEPANAT